MINLPALLELKHVSKTFELESGSILKVLEDVDVQVREGEVVALLGPSGSGKSTCLRIMAGIIEASKGQTLARGHEFKGMNLDVSLVFQSFALLPWQTVFSNIALALRPLSLGRDEVRQRVKRVIDLVGLEGFEEAYPRELSGGMKQRVGIARALVMERPVLFLDEPFSALDVLTADTLRTEILTLFKERKIETRSMVLVTHNIQEAVTMADRILVMGANPGRIRHEFLNDIPYPRDDASPQFKGLVNKIHAVIAETFIPDAPVGSTQAVALKESVLERIPDVQIGAVIGLLEALSDVGGSSDIFELAQKVKLEFGITLYLVKSAELLELVNTPRQRVELSDEGWRFVDGDINFKKRNLHEHFGRLRVVQATAVVLRQEQGFQMSWDKLLERFTGWFPNENSEKILETLINWGRFAEYFGYNDNTQDVYLDLGQETV